MKSNKKLIILSTCTSDKRFTPDPSCCLDECIREAPEFTLKEWLEKIQSPKLHKCQAKDLYKGSHWKETLACVNAAVDKGFAPELWVLSAGWGLIPASYKISPYSATFAIGKNSIHNLPWPSGLSLGDRSRKWWQGINQNRNLKKPQSLAGLPSYFSSHSNLCFLLILSKEYYLAAEPEIIELISCGAEVIIVSSGLYSEIGSASPLARDYILPLNDKFKQVDEYLNKTNVSLNARLATWIISNHSDKIKKGLSELYKAIAHIEESLPAMKRRDVVKMSDDEVIQFIDKNFVQEVSSATKMLKLLRHKENKSCEQKRFGNLFRKYVKHNAKGGFFDV